jgi:hypothetical protein
VRTRFGPDDETAFFLWRDGIVERFERTPGGTDRGRVAQQVLDFKWGYLDGDMGRWSPGDIEEILLGLYPRKVVLEPGDESQVVEGLTALLRFLAVDGLLDGGEATARRLSDGTAALGGAFRRAMADEGRWGMGKRLMSGATSSGFDVTDQASLDAWMAKFNQLPRAERDRILGTSPGGSGLLGAAGPLHAHSQRPTLAPLPPITLPPLDALRQTAQASLWADRVRRLAEFVRDGRPLTQRGNLKLADAKALVDVLETDDRVDETIGDRTFKTQSAAELTGVDLTFRLACAAGVLAVDRSKVRPGPRVELAAGDADPLDLVEALLWALLDDVGPLRHRWRRDTFGWGWYAEDVDAALSAVMLDLYRAGAPAGIEDLGEEMWEMLLDTYVLDDVDEHKLDHHHDLVRHAVRHACERLAELGIVTVTGVEERPSPLGTVTESFGGEVGLTPLGLWALQRMASPLTDAPIAGALAERDAAALLRAAADLPADLARAEIDAWVARRDDAAEQIVAALPDADATARGLGFRALLALGPEAADAVNRLAGHDELDPWVTVWRVDVGHAGDEVGCGGDPERFVRLLGAVLELWGSDATAAWVDRVAGAGGPAVMIGAAWRVQRPETEDVLAAVGAAHPDKTVAKAARKALFKHRMSRPAS